MLLQKSTYFFLFDTVMALKSVLISHFRDGYNAFPYDVVHATKRGDGGVLVAIYPTFN